MALPKWLACNIYGLCLLALLLGGSVITISGIWVVINPPKTLFKNDFCLFLVAICCLTVVAVIFWFLEKPECWNSLKIKATTSFTNPCLRESNIVCVCLFVCLIVCFFYVNVCICAYYDVIYIYVNQLLVSVYLFLSTVNMKLYMES